MTLLKLLSSSNYLVINKDLMKVLGIEETILLGELASEYDYWYKKQELEDDYFYSTIENVEKNTTLSKYKQTQAMNKLKELGIIETKLKGIPAKRYIKINEDRIEEVLQDKMYKDFLTSCQKINQLDGEVLTTNSNNINNNIINNTYSNNINSKTLIYSSNLDKEEKEINKEKEENYGIPMVDQNKKEEYDPFAEYKIHDSFEKHCFLDE